MNTNPKPMGEKWAVVGASGFVGNALVQELKRQGKRVVLVRAPRLSLEGPRTPVSLQTELDASTAVVEALASAFDGVSIAINAAGLASPDAPDTDELFGANSLLPAVILRASACASVSTVVHLSSVAVQGNRPVLDASVDVSPFSPYSMSKALGEQVLLDQPKTATSLRVVRATSVQGPGRLTTQNLQRIAGSRFASVARPGDRPSAVSSIVGLVDFVLEVACDHDSNQIRLQRWEGATTAGVLYWAGGRRRPMELPAWFCHATLGLARVGSRLFGGKFAGHIRRLEVMWFGQRQCNQLEQAETAMTDSLRRALLPAVAEEIGTGRR